jgi:hypothetical protein
MGGKLGTELYHGYCELLFKRKAYKHGEDMKLLLYRKKLNVLESVFKQIFFHKHSHANCWTGSSWFCSVPSLKCNRASGTIITASCQILAIIHLSHQSILYNMR